MRAHPFPASSRLGVATCHEYDAVGWSHSARRHAVHLGRLLRVAPGRFAPPAPHLNAYEQADLALARRAVAGTIPRGRVAASHLAAAYLHGCPFWAPSPRACVCAWDHGLRHMAGLHVHHLADAAPLVTRLDVPVTSMARTIVDIACEFGTESALVTGDFALRHHLVTTAELIAAIDDCRGHTGIDRARLVPDLLDPLAESPLESRSRWHMHHHDLPLPLSQVRIHTLDGRFLARVDHYWAEGVVGEADGRQKYIDRDDSLLGEKNRQQALEDTDLEVTRWGPRDLRDFSDAAGRVERARARRRRRMAAGEAPRWIAISAAGEVIPVPRLL